MTGTSQIALEAARRLGLELEPLRSIKTRGSDGAQVRDGSGDLYFLKSAALDAPAPAGWGAIPSDGILQESGVLRDLGAAAENLLVDSGVDDGIAWLVTRWFDGPSLRNWAQTEKGSLDRPKLHASAVGAAESLSRVHDAGYLHCDVQPAHLILTTSGVRLIDFELSRRKDDRSTPYSGALIHYCAPEVAQGMKERSTEIHVDELTDVYALGASLLMAATRHVPIDYGTEEQLKLPMDQKLDCIIEGRRFTLAQADVEKWPEFEGILGWAMSPERDKRCPSAGEFVHALATQT